MADDPLLDILSKLKLRTARLGAASAGAPSFPSPLGVTALACSPDGRRLAIGRSNNLHFLDAQTLESNGDPERPVHEVKRLSFTSDGSALFYKTIDRAGTLRVEPAHTPGLDLVGYGGRSDAFLAPARGAMLRIDRTHVYAFGAETGEAAGQVAFADMGGPEAKAPWKVLDIASDGRFALCARGVQAGKVTLKRVDLASGKGPEVASPLPGTLGDPPIGVIAPGGAWAVIADGWANFATLDLDTMKFATPIIEEGRWTAWAMAASPDGRHWASARTKFVSVWRLAAEHPVERIDLDEIDDAARALTFGPDGALFIGTASGRVLRIEIPRDA